MPMKSTIIDNQRYVTPSWEYMGKLCFKLSQEILNSNKKFDRLVALVKGGLTWSRTIVDYLNIPELSTFQVNLYTDIATKRNHPIITQSLPAVINGENILLFDEVVDTGETLKTACEYLKMRGTKSITTASLVYKPWSKTKPDFYAENVAAWVIFPHEIREMINLLKNKWRKTKISNKEIYNRLIKIGIQEEEIKYFLKIKED